MLSFSEVHTKNQAIFKFTYQSIDVNFICTLQIHFCLNLKLFHHLIGH